MILKVLKYSWNNLHLKLDGTNYGYDLNQVKMELEMCNIVIPLVIIVLGVLIVASILRWNWGMPIAFASNFFGLYMWARIWSRAKRRRKELVIEAL